MRAPRPSRLVLRLSLCVSVIGLAAALPACSSCKKEITSEPPDAPPPPPKEEETIVDIDPDGGDIVVDGVAIARREARDEAARRARKILVVRGAADTPWGRVVGAVDVVHSWLRGRYLVLAVRDDSAHRTSPFSLPSAGEMALAPPPPEGAAAPTSAPPLTSVTIAGDGSTDVDGVVVARGDPKALDSALSRAIAMQKPDGGGPIVSVNADTRIPLKAVIEIIKAAQRRGARIAIGMSKPAR